MMKAGRILIFCACAALSALALRAPAFALSEDAAKIEAAKRAQAEKKAKEEARIAAKNVWQAKFKKGAVEDRFMELNTEKEPQLKMGFKPLFNGKDLRGWKQVTGNASFTVKDKMIVGEKNREDKVNSFLATTENYKDFILTLEFKWVEKGNSGVMVLAALDNKGLVSGPQIEIETSEDRRWTGGIYGERAGAWKYSLSREEHEAARQAVKDYFEWNRLTVWCKNGVIKTWVNGVPCAVLDTKKDKNLSKFADGFIALQVHQGGSGISQFRNIKIKKL
ncbi:MAG: DUF1080 domain-containing protein [Opitutales bacterium]|nr:DUF1080 domain-containing protein [Opitutales bacterium]